MQFEYNRISIENTTFEDNECLPVSTDGSYSWDNYNNISNCIKISDSAVTIKDSQFSNNDAPLIIGIERTEESYYDAKLNGTVIDIEDITVTNGVGESFLFLLNFTNGDVMSIKDSLFDSPNYASILYATSSLDLSGNGSETGDTTYIEWDNNTVVNCSKAA